MSLHAHMHTTAVTIASGGVLPNIHSVRTWETLGGRTLYSFLFNT